MKFIYAFVLCVLVLSANITVAHPHAWISFKTTFLFNEKGEIVAMRQHWLFDKMYTGFALHDYDPNRNGKLDKDEIMKLAQENLSGLKEFNYFTTLETGDGTSVVLDALTAMDSYIEDKQIAMDFTLPFKTPFDPLKQNLVYRVSDPTYYTDMGHYEKNPIQFEGKAPKNCRFDVSRPVVDINMIAAAASLDKKATAPKDLGYSFAEKATISCK